MNPLHRFQKSYTQVSEEEAENLQHPPGTWYTVEARPPQTEEPPATVPGFVRGILELQSAWLGLRNTSPITVYEIRRNVAGQLRFQFSTPLKRVERKIRTQLSDEIPGVQFTDGVNGVAVSEGESIGGGLLTTGRRSNFPLETEFDDPPINALVAALHRHAMPNTRFIVQIIFQPVAGYSLQDWWWRKTGYQHRNYLTKEKQKLWGSISPTRREKQQAHSIDEKTGNSRYNASIRFLVVGAGDSTASRVKELATGFNRFENPVTGQYLDAVTIRRFRRKSLLKFAEAIAQRRFQGWSRRFRATTGELAALLTLPSRSQDNITYSHA